MPNDATMPIPQEWLRDLLDHDATPGDFLPPEDVLLEDDDEAPPPPRASGVVIGGRRGDQ
jgi:hypothetical protein